MTISIDASVASKIGFASHQNVVPLLRELELANGPEEIPGDLVLPLRGSAVPSTKVVAHRSAVARHHAARYGSRHRAQRRFFRRPRRKHLRNCVVAPRGGRGDARQRDASVELLARNQWGGIGSMDELLPAFVMPNDRAVDRILKAASDILRRAGRPDGIDGYQAKSRTRVWELASAGRRCAACEYPMRCHRPASRMSARRSATERHPRRAGNLPRHRAAFRGGAGTGKPQSARDPHSRPRLHRGLASAGRVRGAIHRRGGGASSSNRPQGHGRLRDHPRDPAPPARLCASREGRASPDCRGRGRSVRNGDRCTPRACRR